MIDVGVSAMVFVEAFYHSVSGHHVDGGFESVIFEGMVPPLYLLGHCIQLT